MALLKIAAPITPAWQRAAERAAEDRAAGRVAVRIGCRTYAVPSASAPGAGHVVRIESVTQLRASCDCAAGQRGLPCRHAAQAISAAARRIAQAERAAPAPAPAEADAAAKAARAAENDRKMARFALR